MNSTHSKKAHTGEPNFSEVDFKKLSNLIYSISGIVLNSTKKSLLSSRVSKRLRILNLKDISTYLKLLESPSGQDEYINLIDVISTNYTYFFREENHFDYLKKHVEELEKNGQRKIRVWSCASSTGEEPYSIALQLNQFQKKGMDVKILATDISISVLEECKQGIYSKDKLSKVPKNLISSGFERMPQNTNSLQIKNSVRSMLSFNWINLSQPPFPMQGPFDFIFCRNVMIYFDDEVRQRLVDEIYRVLAIGGIFVVGHSESLSNLNHSFKTLSASVYQKV